MIRKYTLKTATCLATCLVFVGCEKKFNPADGAPPSAQVVPSGNMSLVSVDQAGAISNWSRPSKPKLTLN